MIKELTTKEELEKMSEDWNPTWEGLKTEGLEEQLKEIEPDVEIAYCTGKTYNDVYGLTGNNAYPDDLTIVFLTKYNKDEIMKWKLLYGCRWATDVRDNNLRREGR